MTQEDTSPAAGKDPRKKEKKKKTFEHARLRHAHIPLGPPVLALVVAGFRVSAVCVCVCVCVCV